MLEVEKWAQDKPYLIAICAPQIASVARDIHIDFKQLKSRRFGSHDFRLHHLPPWLALYRSHRRAKIHLRMLFSTLLGKELIEIFDEFMKEVRKVENTDIEVLRDNLPTEQEFQLVKEVFQEILAASFADLKDEFSNAPADPETKEALRKFISENKLDSAFFMFVTVPCWLLYKTHPTKLYREARKGNFDAIERILRLDPLMIHDPYVGMKIADYRFNHKPTKYRKLMGSPFKLPKGGIDRKNIIISIAGLISTLSHVIKKPLTAPEIIKLIEAMDIDCNSNLMDDLPKEPDALARALQPDRNLWRKIFTPDKKM